MIKVVLDTNILVSANLKPESLPALVVSMALSHGIQMYVSSQVLEEYEQVLQRPKFRFAPDHIEAFLQLVRKAAILIPHDLPTISVSGHESDNRLLECAEAARADFLVTGNTRHFPARWKTARRVTAREFLEIVGPELLTGEQ